MIKPLVKVLAFLVCLTYHFNANGQKATVIPDSLLHQIEQQKDNASKVSLLINWGFTYENSNFDLAEALFKKSVDISYAVKDYKKVVETYSYWSYIYSNRGDYETCAEKIADAKRLLDKVNDKSTLLKTMMAESDYYDKIEQYDKAISLRNKEIEIAKELKDSLFLAAIQHNIGITYHKSGNQEMADSLIRMAYAINLKINNKGYIMNNLSMLANINGKINNHKKSIHYNLLALSLAEESKDPYSICLVNLNLGNQYTYTKEFKKAKEHLDKGYKLSLFYGFKEWRQNALQFYAAYYQATKEYPLAINFYEKYINLKDSILNETTTGKLADLELELNQKKIELLNEAKAKTDARLKEQKAINEKQSFQFYAVVGGLIILSICMIFIYRSFLQKKKANQKILEQNVLLESKNKEIAQQKIIVEEKNREVIDSINYAHRLQSAILPSALAIATHFKKSFLFYAPKDIVAGDFYFLEEFNNHVFIAVADCTGHGVPGALMSVLCSNALSRSIKEFHLTDPGEILNKTRELVSETFAKSGHDVKDGMDISFLSIHEDKKGNHDHSTFLSMKWSGANTPLWYVENGELKEIKADKQPIGKSDNAKPFTSHELSLSLSSLFLFTDGYSDQFGGMENSGKGKKLKSSNFKKLLFETSNLPIDQQRVSLRDYFNQWKNDYEQTDDVCVIGIKF